MVRLAGFLTFFLLLTGMTRATTCDLQKAVQYLSQANLFINADPPTRENATKATQFAGLAVDMDGACIKTASDAEEIGNLYLGVGASLAIAAAAQDRLGNHTAAIRFGNQALKVWREIAAERAYSGKIRAAAQRQLDAYSK